MELKNGYKIIYSANNRVSETLPNVLYASTGIPASTDVMLKYYENGTTTEIDKSTIKLVYSDGKYLYVSTTGIPAETDKVVVIKSGDTIVFGEVKPALTTMTAAPRTTTRRARVVEQPVEPAEPAEPVEQADPVEPVETPAE